MDFHLDPGIINEEYNDWCKRQEQDQYFDQHTPEEYVAALSKAYFREEPPVNFLCQMGLRRGTWPRKRGDGDNFCIVDIEKDGSDFVILEMGCGFGRLGGLVSPFVRTYHGIDLSDHIIRRGNRAIEDCGITNMKLFPATDMNLDFLTPCSYDLIFTSALFIHTPPDVTRHYLLETAKLLKDTGVFVHHLNLSTRDPSLNAKMNFQWPPAAAEVLFMECGLNVLGFNEEVDFAPNSWRRNFIGVKTNGSNIS